VPSDAGALARLCQRAHVAVTLPLFATGWLLVLDAPGGEIGAAIHVELASPTGQVDTLIVDPALGGQDVDARLLGVAAALCAAHGCERMELTAATS
jgi:hypothetical protein